MSPDGKGCMDRNECLDLPCLNGATCINMDPKERYQCRCLDGFWGANCELVQEGQTLKLSMGALAAILVCLLIILSERTVPLPFQLKIYIIPPPLLPPPGHQRTRRYSALQEQSVGTGIRGGCWCIIIPLWCYYNWADQLYALKKWNGKVE